MNLHASPDSSASSPSGSEEISRRAYELWEKEGRPEGCDLRHWLQAEQELGVSRSDDGSLAETRSSPPANTGSDVRPLQGTRAAAAANRESKRGSNSPFGAEKSPANGNSQSAARRKPSSAPPL